MASFLYKPISQGQIGGGRGVFLIENTGFVSGGWYDKNGQLLERFERFQGAPEPGQRPGVKFTMKNPGSAYGENAIARFTDSAGKVYEYNIPNAGGRYEGDYNNPASLQYSNKGPQGGMHDMVGWGMGAGGGGYPGAFAPGTIGYGAYPAYIGGMYPSPSLVNFEPIEAAPYNYTDPFEFGADYGDFARSQISKNFDLSTDLAMSSLEAELASLGGFVPAASALKRQQTSIDNQFNQAERTRQVDSALPGLRGALGEAQTRAETFARGEVPDSITDRAMELNVRSDAADIGSASGFGGRSIATQKLSNLMSAENRIKLSQYGDEALRANAQLQSNLFLAPTEYSDAGSQVRVMPSVSASQLIQQNLGEINQQSMIPASTAFQTEVQQQQFQTNLEQDTRRFNASTGLDAQKFNATAENQFAQNLFAYQAGYANSLAGAQQTDINTNVALEQQQRYEDIFKDFMNQAQDSGTFGSIGQVLGIIGSLFGLAGKGGAGFSSIISGLVDYLKEQFKGDGNNSDSDSDSGSDSGGGSDSDSSDAPDLDTDFGGGGSGGGDGESIPEAPPELDTPEFDEPSYEGGDTVPPPFPEDDYGFGDDVSDYDSDTEMHFLRAAAVPVMRSAGVYAKPQATTEVAGYGNNGQPVYMDRGMRSNNDVSYGSKYTKSVAQTLEGFQPLDGTDRAHMQALSESVSNGTNIAELSAYAAGKDEEAFVTKTLQTTGLEGQSGAKGSAADKLSKSARYTAKQLYKTWGQMSASQKSAALAALGVQNKAYGKDKQYIGSIPVVKDKNGKTAMTVGDGMSLLQAGYNAYGLVKNYNAVASAGEALGAEQSPYALARVGQQYGLLGVGQNGALVNGVSADSLGTSGWKAAPHLGAGTMMAEQGAQLPSGYTRIATTNDGMVIAAPQASAAQARNALTVDGMPSNDVQQIRAGWQGSENAPIARSYVGGNAATSGLYKMADTNPYVAGSVGGKASLSEHWNRDPDQGVDYDYDYAAKHRPSGSDRTDDNIRLGSSAITAIVAGQGTEDSKGNISYGHLSGGNVKRSYKRLMGINDLPKDQQATKLQQGFWLGVGDYYTGGAASYWEYYGRKYWPGTMKKLDSLNNKINPENFIYEKAIGNVMGGKSQSQSERDYVRNAFKRVGAADKDFNLTLADGTKASIGIDGKGERHSFTNPEIATKKRGQNGLYAYDLDYTNDLDFVSGMAGVGLSRLVTGTSGTNVGQLGSQVGNAALKNVGYNQKLTSENFNKVMANHRAFYAQSGIKNKADAYQLTNQMLTEGRISEAEAIGMQQAFNMMYDKNGFQTAQQLMTGRNNATKPDASSKLPEGLVYNRRPLPIKRGPHGGKPIQLDPNKPVSNDGGRPLIGL